MTDTKLTGREDDKSNEVRLMVTIPFEEYQQLQNVLLNFKTLINMNAEAIAHHFRSELNHYRMIVHGRRDD